MTVGSESDAIELGRLRSGLDRHGERLTRREAAEDPAAVGRVSRSPCSAGALAESAA